MVDIAALMKVFPVSGLRPQCVAYLGVFVEVPLPTWHNSISLLEPPAGQRVPYIDPMDALEQVLRREGVARGNAKVRARKAVARMKDRVRADRWVTFFDHEEPESRDCLPVIEFVAWLREERRRAEQLFAHPKLDVQVSEAMAREKMLVPSDLIRFFEQAAEIAASTPMFRGPDNWNKPWSLENSPTLPPAKAMIEFVPGAPWWEIVDEHDAAFTEIQFQRWREAIRPVAAELEKVLGEPVYHFSEENSETDDDNVHRFLILHWCCTYKPQSAFVRYLLKISGAKDVDELKTALIDPANYTHPFKMNDAFLGVEALSCHMDYLSPEVNKTVAVVFSTEEGREVAQSLLPQKIGATAFIVAPKELVTDAWIKQATRHCRRSTGYYLSEHTLHEQAFEILALADELCVIGNVKTPHAGFDLGLSQGAENLLWLAYDLGVDAEYFYLDRAQLANPEGCLEKRGVPERVAALKAQRAAFTRELKEIRLYNDYCSSGLWENGMLDYDLLDLPFPLLRRIVRWQRNFDDTVTPPDKSTAEWWERHDQEGIEIAKALQAAVGSEIPVKFFSVKDG